MYRLNIIPLFMPACPLTRSLSLFLVLSVTSIDLTLSLTMGMSLWKVFEWKWEKSHCIDIQFTTPSWGMTIVTDTKTSSNEQVTVMQLKKCVTHNCSFDPHGLKFHIHINLLRFSLSLSRAPYRWIFLSLPLRLFSLCRSSVHHMLPSVSFNIFSSTQANWTHSLCEHWLRQRPICYHNFKMNLRILNGLAVNYAQYECQ